jgi:CelD/BcsL family acetyltransferase involved in cellulose biosynthesis
MLAVLMRWKADRYGQAGYADVFGIPWARRLIQRVHATQMAGFTGVLSLLWAGNEMAAAHLGIRSGHVWHSWVVSYAPAFARYSPGLLLYWKMAEAAGSIQVRRIELGGGNYPYKRMLANAATTVDAGAVDRVPGIAMTRRWQAAAGQWVRASPGLRPHARRLLRTYRRLRSRFPA